MKLVLFLGLLTQVANAQEKPSCDKPYRIGRLVSIGNEDLLSTAPARSDKKQMKEMNKKGKETQLACDAFVSKHPNLAVSKEMTYTVTGFAAFRLRGESFCGSEGDLTQQYMKETK